MLLGGAILGAGMVVGGTVSYSAVRRGNSGGRDGGRGHGKSLPNQWPTVLRRLQQKGYMTVLLGGAILGSGMVVGGTVSYSAVRRGNSGGRDGGRGHGKSLPNQWPTVLRRLQQKGYMTVLLGGAILGAGMVVGGTVSHFLINGQQY